MAEPFPNLARVANYRPPNGRSHCAKDDQSKLRASILEIEDFERNMRHRKSDQERSLGQLKISLQHCLDRLKDMECTKSRLLYALKNSGTVKIDEAYQWLQEHRSALNKEVYGPVLLEVNVSNRDPASYLEGHIPYYKWKIREMEISLKEHEKFALQASLHLEYCFALPSGKKEVEDHMRQLAAAKQQAEAVTVITPELEKAFLEMPTAVEELEAAIQDNISPANSILFLNPNILAEYEDRQRQIETIARKYEADKRELTRCLAEINALKSSFGFSQDAYLNNRIASTSIRMSSFSLYKF